MSALFCFLLASTVSLTTSYTLITPGEATKFREDWAYQATQASFTDSSESWWSKASAAMEDLGRTDTFMGDKIWGWWRMDTDDPSNMFMRYFQCSSYSTAYISFDVYHCSYTYDGQSRLYYNRLSTDAGSANIEIEYGNNGLTWEYLDDGPCGEAVKKTTVTDSFITSSTSQFSITFTKDLERARLQSDTGSSTYSRQILGFNNMEIRCDRIETDSPSPAPTGATSHPSTSPSKFPTPAPTTNPSQTPIVDPTKAPVTAKPSTAPITHAPTPAPTDVPSRYPTEAPTLKPTEAPTKKPTGKPSKVPTESPTSKRSMGRQFSDAFGATQNEECNGGWMKCNLVVFIILLVVVVVVCCYWILGGVWFKRRLNHRPLKSQLAKDKVEMGGGTAAHSTASKWKSAWELEQEQAQAQGGGGDGGDGGDGGNGDW